MSGSQISDFEVNRRRWLKLGAASALAASLPATLLRAQSASPNCAPTIPLNHEPSNGRPCPYPIPWLDKNGNHNQPAMPNVELSSIYHFKGKLGRCSGFHGMGTDSERKPSLLGNPHDRLQLHVGRVLGSAPGA